MNESAPFLNNDQVWEAVAGCEVQIQYLFSAPITFSGACRLTAGERVRIMSASTDPLTAVVSFLPVRYDELHVRLVPLDIRDTPRYKAYRLSVKTDRFYEQFRLVEERA